MNDDVTYLETFQPGEPGDTRVTLNLTARELASIQLLVLLGTHIGAGELAYIACAQHGVQDIFLTELRAAEARIGLALSDALGHPGHKTDFSAVLARIDQERAAREGRN